MCNGVASDGREVEVRWKHPNVGPVGGGERSIIHQVRVKHLFSGLETAKGKG